VFNGSSGPFVVQVHPKEAHERLAAQQATFLCPSTIRDTFEEALVRVALRENFPVSDIVRRATLTPQAVAVIVPRLFRMNIHEASLFPDVAGYALFVADNVRMLIQTSGDWMAALRGLERTNWL
jgi:hypothetical protein